MYQPPDTIEPNPAEVEIQQRHPSVSHDEHDGQPATAPEHASRESNQTSVRPHSDRNPLFWILFNVIVPLVLLAGAIYLVIALGSNDPAARPPIDDTRIGRLKALPAVQIAVVPSLEDSGASLHLGVDGTVVPYREVTLATEVAGRIIEKSANCEAGRFVKEGDLLMRIDPTDYQLEVKRLERQQQQEYEALGEVDQEMANSQRLLEIAETDIELQRREVKRQEALPKQFASEGDIDRARRSLLQAEQQLVSYQNQLDLLRKRRVKLESSEQLVAIQLESARENLKRTEIKAPIDGVVVREQAELDNFVARGSPVVLLEDTSKVEVAANLRTDQLYWVLNQKKPDTLALTAPAVNDARSKATSSGYDLPDTKVRVRFALSGREEVVYQWSGRLVGYDGIGLDDQTRTVPVRILVEQPQDFEVLRHGRPVDKETEQLARTGPSALVRGMFVSLRLELNPAQPMVILPAEALKPGNRVWQFVPNDQVLEQSIAETEQKDAVDDTATETGAGDVPPSEKAKAKEKNPFDPEAWVAGELIVIEGVRAVDRYLPVGTEDERDESEQKWICEVTDGQLANGDFVVTSPLGNVRSDAFPVRALRSQTDPKSQSLPIDQTQRGPSVSDAQVGEES